MTDIVERLRAYEDSPLEPRWAKGLFAGIDDDVCNEAAAEIERLRAALRKISNMGQTNVPDHWDFRVKAREIARAALREKD